MIFIKMITKKNSSNKFKQRKKLPRKRLQNNKIKIIIKNNQQEVVEETNKIVKKALEEVEELELKLEANKITYL